MGQGFYAQVIDALKQAGCTFRRHGKGDHEIWYSPISNRTFTVDRGIKSRHLANAIMKQAGSKVRF